MKKQYKYILSISIIISLLFITAFIFSNVNDLDEIIKNKQTKIANKDFSSKDFSDIDSSINDILILEIRENPQISPVNLTQFIITNWHGHSSKYTKPTIDSVNSIIEFTSKLLRIELDTINFDTLEYSSNMINEKWKFNYYDKDHTICNNRAYINHDKITNEWLFCLYGDDQSINYYTTVHQDVLNFFNYAERSRSKINTTYG